jgi:uncharacterized protein YbjT (DUF2867 family)
MFVVAGATGQTGGAAADVLLRAGRKIRVLVRDPAKAERWRARGAEVSAADLADERSLADALAGAEGAYLLVPPFYGADDTIADRRRVAREIGAAVSRSEIPHVVLLSSTGAHSPSGTGMILAPREGELAVVPAAKNVTVVRAAFFLENWAPVLGGARESGVIPTFLTPDRRFPMVASADVGAAAAGALLDPARGRRVVELAGPEDLAPDDVARIVGALLGRHVRAELAPIAAVVPTFRGFGMSEDAARLFQGMYEAINTGRAGFEGTGTELRRGRIAAAEVFRKILGMA